MTDETNRAMWRLLANFELPLDHETRCQVANAYKNLIEQHEAFRRDVSDAVESLCNTVFVYEKYLDMRDMLRHRFIIAKPDPLVEALGDADLCAMTGHTKADYAEDLRAAIEARGGKIVWGEG